MSSTYSMAPPNGHLSTPPTSTTAPSAFAMTGSGSGDMGDNALPRISRDFAPPSLSNTRRPATAVASMGGTTVGLDMHGKKQNQHRLDDISENSFQNPFATTVQGDGLSALSVDPHAVPQDSSSWSSSPGSQTTAYTSTPLSAVHTYSYAGGVPNGLARPPHGVARPQTSDGLPSYPTNVGGGVPLPSARSLVSQIPGGYQPVPGSYGGGQVISGFPAAPRYGSFDQAATRYMALGLTPSAATDSELQFVSLAGPTPKKRSRRRYDEIERIYPCGWKGCDKAYGTLNHLNAHVAMQKHGPKRLPAEFKEMRKEWRRKKREEAAAVASKEYSQAAAAAAEAKNMAFQQHHHHAAAMGAAGLPASNDYAQPGSQMGEPYSHGWQRSSDTMAPMYGSTASYSAVPSVGFENGNDPFGHRGSTGSFLTNAPTWSSSDTRPTTANTVSSAGSPTDGRFAYTVPSWGGLSTGGGSSAYERKPSTPGMLPPPTTQPASFQPYMMNQQSIA